MSFPYLIQGNNVVVVIKNKPHTISKTHITYQKVVDAIKANDWQLVEDIIDPKKVVLNYGNGNVAIQGEKLFWKGKEMHGAIVNRMVAMLQDGFPIEPLVLFMENLMKNPSFRSVNELYGFLEKNNLPITPDGHFLAYKKVRGDYLDVYSGKFDNSVGRVVEMERNEVNDNAEQTCSYGLHFCSEGYLRHFSGERVMILKINPADVVSIPTDYNNTKGRCCRYEVVGEVGVNPEDKVEFTAPVQTNANSAKPTGPKEGSGEYIRGYADGYDGVDTNAPTLSQNYRDGFHQGKFDANNERPRRYRYVPVAKASGWPMPNGDFGNIA